ncbi:uncharacterized protein LOC143152393 [Ptiloglossa arizonensis]|uniref:uncharacterized protein LOC143152393 n=1 Tax=Ptiloglossa arizonensis TaxID=3350558 RepID=UPI003F9FD0B8
MLVKPYESKEAKQRLLANAVVARNGATASSPVPVLTETARGNAGDNYTYYTTPEENQELCSLVIENATRTPKRERFLSRVSSFKRKSRHNDVAYRRIRFDVHPVIAETPKRDVTAIACRSIDETETFCNVASSYRSVVDELKRRETPRMKSPSLYKQTLLGQARRLTPVRERRVIVSKTRKRNSIVRRAVRTRRLRHSRCARNGRSRKSFDSLNSPASESISLPDRHPSDICVRAPANVCNRISRSVDSLATRISKTISNPLRSLIRTRNFDDIARWKDENQNDVSVGCSKSGLDETRIEIIGIAAQPALSTPTRTVPNRSTDPEIILVDDEPTNDADIRRATFETGLVKREHDGAPIAKGSGPTPPKRKKREKKIWKFW